MDIFAAIASPCVDSGRYQFPIENCTLGMPKHDEVLVKLEACGVCHTDLLAASGQLGTSLPAVLGHEGVGRILQLGDTGERCYAQV